MERRALKVFFLLLLAQSCNSYDFGSEPPLSIALNADNPTWDNGIGVLVTAKCANCHRPQTERTQFVPSDVPPTFDDIRTQNFFTDPNNAARITQAYERVFNNTEKPMPPHFATPLTSNERDALKKYLSTKVSTVDSYCGTSGSSSNTYVQMAATVNGSCATAACHGGGQVPLFTSLAAVKTNRSAMLRRMKAGTMPPTDATFIQSTAGKAMFDWLCFGSDPK